jgi:hypothetical protein
LEKRAIYIIGMAMLGYCVGDVFTWQVPDGVRMLKVRQILYQPEAAGDDHLSRAVTLFLHTLTVRTPRKLPGTAGFAKGETRRLFMDFS